MSPDLEDKLYNKYPKIFRKEDRADETHAMYYGIQCNDGWYALIDLLCSFIQQSVDRNVHLQIPQAVAQQVKQKLAGLRFNISGGDEMTYGAVQFAEFLSFTICESCGASNAKPFNDGGYWWTACNTCKNRKNEG
jgi:CDGSH-type Zn-finger protein